MKKLQEVFDVYALHPEFIGLQIIDANQKGALDSGLLHIAVRKGNLEHIQVLVENGADINALGDLGFTPLHDAAITGQAKAAKLLLSLGANVSIKNEFNQTPLDVALLGGKTEVCEILKKYTRLEKKTPNNISRNGNGESC